MNQDHLRDKVLYGLERFNNEQRAVYDAVMESYDQNLGKVFLCSQCRWGVARPLSATP